MLGTRRSGVGSGCCTGSMSTTASSIAGAGAGAIDGCWAGACWMGGLGVGMGIFMDGGE